MKIGCPTNYNIFIYFNPFISCLLPLHPLMENFDNIYDFIYNLLSINIKFFNSINSLYKGVQDSYDPS